MQTAKLQSVFIVYSAAFVSLAVSVARDFFILTWTQESQFFFSLVYILAIPSGLIINFITWCPGTRFGYKFWSLIFIIGFTIFSIAYKALGNTEVAVLLALTFLLWISGSIEAKKALVENAILLSRLREAFGAICLIFAILLVNDLTAARLIFLSSLGGWVFILFVRALHQTRTVVETNRQSQMPKLTASFFALNLPVIAINLWALWLTEGNWSLGSLNGDALSRISMYWFQVFAIVCPLFASGHLKISLPKFSRQLAISVILAGFVGFMIIMPLANLIWVPTVLSFLFVYIHVLVNQ